MRMLQRANTHITPTFIYVKTHIATQHARNNIFRKIDFLPGALGTYECLRTSETLSQTGYGPAIITQKSGGVVVRLTVGDK